MGAPHEQYQTVGNGDGQRTGNIQLSLDEAGGEELPAFSVSGRSVPLEISQQIIDEALCLGGGRRNSTLNIAAKFRRQLSPEENVAFLKREYGRGGRGFIIDGQQISVWWDESGIRLALGTSADANRNPIAISWEQAEKRIGELLLLGRYMPGEDLLRVEEHEINELAAMLWYVYRDDIHKLPDEWNAPHGGYPEDVKLIAADLRNIEKLGGIITRLETDLAAAEAEPNHRRWHDTRQLVRDLKDLQREPVTFHAAEMTVPEREKFITQDEIDASLLRGSAYEQGKLTIYDFFEREKDAKERAKFLRSHYGTGGGTHSIPGADDSYTSYDSK